MLNKIIMAHFSPTGGTREVALCIARRMAEHVSEIDFSSFCATNYSFKNGEFVIFAVPVFGGRIPAHCLKHLKSCSGNGAKAVTIAVYGGRDYEDALIELNDCVEGQGFDIVASMALVAEHSMYRTLASGRPDEEDRSEVQNFADTILEKLEKERQSSVTVFGNRPYREWKPLPVTPMVLDTCEHCGLCVEKCPAEAILKGQESSTSPEKCMLCMRCVSICPKRARIIPPPVQKMLEQNLTPFLSVRKENKLFL